MTDTVLAIGNYKDWDAEPLEAEFDTEFVKGSDDIYTLPDDRRAQVRAIAFSGHAPLTGDHMAALPNLAVIANFGVGYDAIDIDAATGRGIKVTNTPNVLNDDVADLTVAMLIAQSRQIVEGSHHVRSGAWSDGPLPLNRKVSGGRAGIVGLGRIGHDIATRLEAFKMDVHYWSRSEKDTPGWTYHADPIDLARAVDFLIVALVGGPETEGFVNRQMLEALGEDGIVINISRGSTIDEDALIEMLGAKKLRGAGLDVFRSEPDLDARFLKLDNVLLQPHQGSGTIETRKAMGQLQRDNLTAFFAGRDLVTPVN